MPTPAENARLVSKIAGGTALVACGALIHHEHFDDFVAHVISGGVWVDHPPFSIFLAVVALAAAGSCLLFRD